MIRNRKILESRCAPISELFLPFIPSNEKASNIHPIQEPIKALLDITIHPSKRR